MQHKGWTAWKRTGESLASVEIEGAKLLLVKHTLGISVYWHGNLIDELPPGLSWRDAGVAALELLRDRATRVAKVCEQGIFEDRQEREDNGR